MTRTGEPEDPRIGEDVEPTACPRCGLKSCDGGCALAASMYPPGWPSCACGRPVLDGHVTCGHVECAEGEARDRAAEEFRR